MGAFGAELLPVEGTVLTHCNAGALATRAYGTALGVIRSAVERGKRIRVFADETRPFLQGARLTAWELLSDGIPVTLITDNMAGHFMQRGAIDAVIVGRRPHSRQRRRGQQDRHLLGRRPGQGERHPLLCGGSHLHRRPGHSSGEEIVIEERDPAEVLYHWPAGASHPRG